MRFFRVLRRALTLTFTHLSKGITLCITVVIYAFKLTCLPLFAEAAYLCGDWRAIVLFGVLLPVVLVVLQLQLFVGIAFVSFYVTRFAYLRFLLKTDFAVACAAHTLARTRFVPYAIYRIFVAVPQAKAFRLVYFSLQFGNNLYRFCVERPRAGGVLSGLPFDLRRALYYTLIGSVAGVGFLYKFALCYTFGISYAALYVALYVSTRIYMLLKHSTFLSTRAQRQHLLYTCLIG